MLFAIRSNRYVELYFLKSFATLSSLYIIHLSNIEASDVFRFSLYSYFSHFSIINLDAFHSLLQKFLYPSILFKSKFISLPVEAIAQKLNLRASAPYSFIPSGKSLFVFFIMFIFCFSLIKLAVLFSISLSKVIPSITSIGSITLPIDLDIFLPSESLTSP